MRIENNLLLISNFKLKNITKEYLSWVNDQSLLKFSRHKNKIYNYKKAISYFNYNRKKKNLFFIIFNKRDKKNIGTLTLNFKRNNIYNIGILIDKKYQNKGLASKVINLFTKNLNFSKNIKYFEIGTNIQHKAMIKVAKKCKFKLSHKNKRYVYFRKINSYYK